MGLPVIRYLLPPTRVLKVGRQDLTTLLRHVGGGVGRWVWSSRG